MHKFLAFLVLQVFRLIAVTCRYRYHGEDHLPKRADGLRGGFIMAFWHQNLISAMFAERGRRCFATMISRSRDGDAISAVAEGLGYRPVRGSSKRDGRDKGGLEARDELVDLMQAGYPGAVTVDGPVGPLYKVRSGVIDISRLAQVPVVPYYAVASRYWSFPSWDRIRMPKPFSTVHVFYGKPIAVAPETTLRQYLPIRKELKRVLDTMESESNPCLRP